jgi:hypothetical protein
MHWNGTPMAIRDLGSGPLQQIEDFAARIEVVRYVHAAVQT